MPIPPTDVAGADRSIAATLIEDGSLNAQLVQANNKAYDRLIGNLESVRANLALTFLEYEKSVDMILHRVGQIYEAFRALKRFDYQSAARHLGQDFLPGPKRRSRFARVGTAAANGWNEVNFGWQPLLQDIHDAVGVLAATIPASIISGSGSIAFRKDNINPDPSTYENMVITGRVGVRHQALVRYNNPNLALLSQLGLVNPAFVIWDAVPFSFVVDWFLPIGKFLRSYTDFVGLEVIDGMTTESWAVSDRSDNKFNPGYVRQSNAWFVHRSLGTPAFRFPQEVQYKHGLWKQITASALLIQKVTNTKVDRIRHLRDDPL